MPDPTAHDVYEVITESLGSQRSRLPVVLTRLLNLRMAGGKAQKAGGLVLSVRERATGTEVFRHIEEIGDDEDHLLQGIQKDLEQMTAAEFKARWVD